MIAISVILQWEKLVTYQCSLTQAIEFARKRTTGCSTRIDKNNTILSLNLVDIMPIVSLYVRTHYYLSIDIAYLNIHL